MVADKLLESAYEHDDIKRRGVLDRFLEFANARAQFGYADIPSMAYPTRRMMNTDMEKIIIDLINIHLYPDIVFPLLKFFTRNTSDADSNLFLANLIESDAIVSSLYNTFEMFKKDIFLPTPEQRTLNVKKIQQFAHKAEDRFSSPLDASARFKYILEFFTIKMNVSSIYTIEDLRLTTLRS